MLKHLTLVLLTVIFTMCLLPEFCEAGGRSKSGGSVSVKGYTRKDGTYVQPHHRSAPDGNFYNNWSTTGNVNPYTGEEGKLNSPLTGHIYVPSTIPNTPYQTPANNDSSSPASFENSPSNNLEPDLQKRTAPNIPANAKLNYLGNGWECQRGFRQSGNECAPVQLPANSTLNYLGNGWVCQEGFRQSGNECIPVQLPPNSKLNILGNGWVCQEGFRQSGNQCTPVQLPPNSKLNILGNGWVCQEGFRQSGNECIPVGM